MAPHSSESLLGAVPPPVWHCLFSFLFLHHSMSYFSPLFSWSSIVLQSIYVFFWKMILINFPFSVCADPYVAAHRCNYLPHTCVIMPALLLYPCSLFSGADVKMQIILCLFHPGSSAGLIAHCRHPASDLLLVLCGVSFFLLPSTVTSTF